MGAFSSIDVMGTMWIFSLQGECSSACGPNSLTHASAILNQAIPQIETLTLANPAVALSYFCLRWELRSLKIALTPFKGPENASGLG